MSPPSGIPIISLFFFFNDTATTEIYTLSLHDALPISSESAPRELRSRATCGIALLPHHRASLAPPSTNNCAFGHDFREAALTNTGRPWPDSHRKVARPEPLDDVPETRRIGSGFTIRHRTGGLTRGLPHNTFDAERVEANMGGAKMTPPTRCPIGQPEC